MVARAFVEPLRSIEYTDISASYADLGTAFEHECRMFRIHNNTEGDMFVSIDGGTTDHFFMESGTFILFDVQANKAHFDDKYVLPVGTQFAVKQSTAPVSGAVYLEVWY